MSETSELKRFVDGDTPLDKEHLNPIVDRLPERRGAKNQVLISQGDAQPDWAALATINGQPLFNGGDISAPQGEQGAPGAAGATPIPSLNIAGELVFTW